MNMPRVDPASGVNRIIPPAPAIGKCATSRCRAQSLNRKNPDGESSEGKAGPGKNWEHPGLRRPEIVHAVDVRLESATAASAVARLSTAAA